MSPEEEKQITESLISHAGEFFRECFETIKKHPDYDPSSDEAARIVINGISGTLPIVLHGVGVRNLKQVVERIAETTIENVARLQVADKLATQDVKNQAERKTKH